MRIARPTGSDCSRGVQAGPQLPHAHSEPQWIGPQAREAYQEEDFLGPLEAAKKKVKALLEARAAALKLYDTDMVEAAAAMVHGTGKDAEMLQLALELERRLGSGAAHGRLLMGLHRTGGHRVEDLKVALLGATYEEITLQIGAISLVLSEAWRMWDLRRVA